MLKMLYEMDFRVDLIKLLGVNFLNILSLKTTYRKIFTKIKRSNLRKSVSKFTPKKVYEIKSRVPLFQNFTAVIYGFS
jgi:hypothetical protein